MKKNLMIVGGALACFVAGLLLPAPWSTGAFLLSYALAGGEVLWDALRKCLRGQMLDEDLLMAVASLGALLLGEYSEGCAVMIFFRVGELFEDYAAGQSRKSIQALMEICPDTATVVDNGVETVRSCGEVALGSTIVIRPGERVPLDCRVLEGSGALDTSALTGESVPRDIAPGDTIYSGCINLSGMLRCETVKDFEHSTASRILELVEDAAGNKSVAERFITRFARWYTPSVVGAAVLLAVLPPLLVPGAVFADWIQRALLFLVVSCPCALVISVPLAFFGGIGGASRRGVLIKGGVDLERLAQVRTLALDKTGTLTQGKFSVREILPAAGNDQTLLTLLAGAERHSTHPIALSLLQAWGGDPAGLQVSEVQEQAGLGLSARVDGRLVLAGNHELITQNGVDCPAISREGTVVYCAADGVYQGAVLIADSLKSDTPAAIAALKQAGVRRTVMLTGDRESTAQAIAKDAGVDEVRAQLMPQDKVACLEALLKQAVPGELVAFVGDGINDAPVLARADVGIAMGGLGSDAAMEAADVVLMQDSLSQLHTAIKISKKTLRLARENIIFALSVKALVLVLGALGYANMWMAVFADVGVSVLAILNSFRGLDTKKL